MVGLLLTRFCGMIHLRRPTPLQQVFALEPIMLPSLMPTAVKQPHKSKLKSQTRFRSVYNWCKTQLAQVHVMVPQQLSPLGVRSHILTTGHLRAGLHLALLACVQVLIQSRLQTPMVVKPRKRSKLKNQIQLS